MKTGSEKSNAHNSYSKKELVSLYETLRDRAFRRPGQARSVETELFLNYGMATWMEQWKDYSSPPRHGAANRGAGNGNKIPRELFERVVPELVSMALNVSKELVA
jgi:hypothetical protein